MAVANLHETLNHFHALLIMFVQDGSRNLGKGWRPRFDVAGRSGRAPARYHVGPNIR